MSEPAAKRHPIDLDEFDRRLRGTVAEPQRPSGAEDPLAELARLVSSSPDPFAPIFAAGRPNPRAPQPAPAPEALRPAYGAPPAERWDEGDEEEEGGTPLPGPAPRSERPVWQSRGLDDGRAPRRLSRHAALLASVALALVLVGAGGVLALRRHGGRFGSPPTIYADARPYKVRPPAQPQSDQIEDSTTLLDRGPQAPRPAHIVNTEEQPVDLSLAASAKNAPPPSADDGGFPRPRLVKTVSVRPDGTIISTDGSDESAPAPAPSSGATGSSNSTPLAAPQPESAADDQSSDGAQSAVAPASAPPPASQAPSQAPSFANVVDQAADNSDAAAPPAQQAPVAPSPSAAPVQAANMQSADLSEDAAPAAATASGGWAVQLSAPPSERDAHVEIVRLEKRFARELSGHKLVSFAAKADGRAFWRVRVAALSLPAASSLCSHIKSAGGACFVARN